MSTLCLDLATTLGWAHESCGVITSGAVSFTRRKGRKTIEDEHEGIVFLRFDTWLREKLADDKPTRIGVERPGHFASASAAFVAIGLRGILYRNAAYHNIPVLPFSPKTLKKRATGNGNADKPAMIAAAKLRWPEINIADDNEADALWILEAATSGEAKAHLREIEAKL